MAQCHDSYEGGTWPAHHIREVDGAQCRDTYTKSEPMSSDLQDKVGALAEDRASQLAGVE